MASIKVFADLMSQPSRALVMFCRVTKIPHEFKSIMIKKGEHQTEEMTKLNPFQKMPFIVEDGKSLTESMAILRYLTNVHEVADHWYPKAPMDQQKVDAYLHWQHTNTRLQCAMYFQVK